MLRTDDGAGFFDTPYPIPHRVRDDSTLVMADFPNPGGTRLMDELLAALERSPVGFGTTTGVWMRFTGPLDPDTLPAPDASLEHGSPVFLVNVDDASPDLDERVPVEVIFKADAETYSPANFLVVMPRPGFVLRPRTLYATVVTDGVLDAEGRPLGSPLALEQLKAGQTPGGAVGDRLVTELRPLWEHLDRAAIPRAHVRAATIYRTGDPHAELDRLWDWIHAQPVPEATDASWIREHDTYCVVEARVQVPLFQDGERPYTTSGGEIRFDPAGEPATLGSETIRFSVAIPKATMPTTGWPLLFYAPGQGGAYTQVVDRGTFWEQDHEPGRGPALYLADVGIASLSFEAPLTGPRHPDGATDGLEFWNVTNPVAFRDNVRQAALDFTSIMRMAADLTLPASSCPGADAGGDDFFFDTGNFLLHGHSTGATIGSIVLGLEPGLRAGLLSGVGGSWLYNLVIKFEPMDFSTLVHVMLNYKTSDDPDIADPAIQLFQTLAESSEPMNWARRWAAEPRPDAAPRDILVIEGVIDGYFPPPAVNALALAAALEPVEPLVEDTLLEALQLVGAVSHAAPAADNLETPDGPRSSLLIQYTQPPGISGHYVPFELPEPKHQYKCFFESLVRSDTGTVSPADASPLAPCSH